MAETTLDEQLVALKNESFSRLKERTQLVREKNTYEEFLNGYTYELEDMQKLQEALGQEMHDPSCFQVALQEMPRRLVTLLVMLVKIESFELAHTAVCLILLTEKSNLNQRKKWAQILHQLLNQLLPHWDNIAIKNLDQELTAIIEKKRDSNKAWRNETIEAVFEANLWPGLELLYMDLKDSLLCGAHLNKIMLRAAWSENWSVFMECLELGANVTETVDVDGVRAVNRLKQSADQTVMKKVKYSILHEAFKNGLDIQQLEHAGRFAEEMVNALDCRGNTLLHWAISKGAIKEVLFLMKRKADVNIVNKSGMTAIQLVVIRKAFDTSDIDMLVAMMEGSDKIEPHSWAPVKERSALCLLCVSGKYQHVLTAVEKGADVKHRYFKLTLIDLVILKENLPFDLRKQTLAVLLNKPISLGAFHASVVAQRPLSEANMVYRDNIGLCPSYKAGKPYLYPLLCLLFPLMSTRSFQRKQVDLLKMLVEGDAVCDAELLALKPYIQKLKDEDMHEAVEYLLPLIEALPKARRVRDGYIPQEEVPAFENKGTQFLKSPPTHPIGPAPDDVTKMEQAKQAASNPAPPIQQQVPTSKAAKKNAKRKEKKKQEKTEDGQVSQVTKAVDQVNLSSATKKETTGPEASGDGKTNLAKKLKKLKKKLKQTEDLERKIKSGELENPEKDQLEKVARKAAVLEEIEDLQAELQDS